MQTISRIAFVALAIFLTGCASSKVTAFRDPEFAGRTFSSVAVFATNMTLDAAVEVERQVCEKVAPSPCISGKSILPPTRDYSAEDVERFLTRSGVDSVLVIALASDRLDTQYFGTVSTGSATAQTTGSGTVNFYGNTAFWAGGSQTTASGQTVSTPVYGYSRVAFGQLALFERSSGLIAWRGEVRIEGQGLLNVTDSAFISSATSKVANELKRSSVLR
jgi:hypothetical protein